MSTNQVQTKPAARAASLEQILSEVVPLYLSPAPSKHTLRVWFDAAKIPRFKANVTARRGGGPIFYSVAGVEKFFRQRIGVTS